MALSSSSFTFGARGREAVVILASLRPGAPAQPTWPHPSPPPPLTSTPDPRVYACPPGKVMASLYTFSDPAIALDAHCDKKVRRPDGWMAQWRVAESRWTQAQGKQYKLISCRGQGESHPAPADGFG